ncbi:hypothetical protein M9Y10_002292 [Tritrichomonas musculus]|uniref:Importin N-terminal domain-containing protein n=1 Tax=Tritrichomonas musculus TaxID=1915356 RepID=A0ABR2L9D8_9EUKA
MDALQNEPQKELNDQQLLSIINELNENKDKFDKFRHLKAQLHMQGLNCSLKLCSLAVQYNVHQNVKYILFSNLSSLLHPRAPPEFLLEILNQFVPLVPKEEFRLSKLAICQCIANAFYHLASEANIQNISHLLQSLGNDSIIFLSELIGVLKCALDVPMLSLKNFVIIVNVLPNLFPMMIDCFFNKPDQTTFDILSFYLTTFRQPPLQNLLDKINTQMNFDINEFMQQVRNILNSKMLYFVSALENVIPSDLKFLFNFFTLAVTYGIDPSNTMNILGSIFKIEINSYNIETFCLMIKDVIKVQSDLLNIEFINPFFIISVENAKCYNLENLYNLLYIITLFYAKLYEPFPKPDCPVPVEIFSQFVQQILPLLIRQYPVDNKPPTAEEMGITVTSLNGEKSNNNENDSFDEYDDDDDQGESDLVYRSEIIQFIASLSRDDPLPSTNIIEQTFNSLVESNSADYYVCEWVLELLDQFLQYSISMEKGNNESELISQVLQKIIMLPITNQLAAAYPSILLIICDALYYINNKEMGFAVFRMAINQSSSNDQIMKKTFLLAEKYEFSLLDEIPPNVHLSLKILSLLASYSPSPVIVQRIDNLMQTGDTKKMQEATALIAGIQKSIKEIDFPINISNYTIQLTNQKMFAEAFRINRSNPEACMQIIDIASQYTFDEDDFVAIVSNALQAAENICFGILTEKTLIYSNINFQLENNYSENIFMITNLLIQHKYKIIDGIQEAGVTDQTLLIFINFARVLMANDRWQKVTISNIVELLIFFFDRIFPLIDDNYWLIIFHFFFYNNMEIINRDSYDLLFQFALADFNRYRSAFLAVISQATDNSEELFNYLHSDISKDTAGDRNLYRKKFICVYKAFDYYRYFT